MKKSLSIFILTLLGLRLCADSVPFAASPVLSRGEYEAVKSASEQTDTAKALEILLEASRGKNAGAGLWFNLGNVQMRAGDGAAAAQSYAKAVGLMPSFFAARCNLAFALSEQGRDSEAAEQMRSALALSGGSDAQILLWFASKSSRAADYSAALNFCNQALLYAPENRDAQFAKASLLCRTGSFDEAERLAASLADGGKFGAKAVRLVGVCRAKRGDFAGAAAAFEILKKSKAATEADLAFLGDAYFRCALYAKAAENYAAAKRTASVENAAYAMLESGDYAGAEALAGTMSEPQSRKFAGLAKFAAGDFAAARGLLEAYVEKVGDDSRALFALAEACAGLGDFPRAETFYRRAAFDPKFELASLYGLLRAALAKKDYLGALEYARSVEKKQPSKEVSLYVKHLESFVSRAQ